MSVYAAQASFFIILASIPFLMLLLSLIQATPLVNESDLLSLVVQMVPDTLDGLVVYVLDSLHSDSPMALLSATAIAALWSSSRGMLSIERGLNRVWGTEIQRNYIVRRIICAGYTVLFSLMCLLCMVLLVFGEQIQKQVWAWIPLMSTFDFLAFPVRGLVTLAILFIFFLGYLCGPSFPQAFPLKARRRELPSQPWAGPCFPPHSPFTSGILKISL